MSPLSGSAFTFPPERVIEIYHRCQARGIVMWIDGGWAVDALAGRQTRDHQDLDLLVPMGLREVALQVLSESGFAVDADETELPHRLVMVDSVRKLIVDFHLVTLHEDGCAVQRITNYREGVPSYEFAYSREGLLGRGVILGVDVSCVTLDEQVRGRKEKRYAFDHPDRMRAGGINADVHDLEVLERLRSGQLA